MTIKKLLKQQVYQAKLAIKFNFVIFYMLYKENSKVNLFTYYLNNYLDNNYDN